MDEQIIRQVARELMENTDLVYVSTIGEEGYPRTRAMNNLRNLKRFGGLADFFNRQKNDFIVYLATSKISAKIDQIRKSPKVCLYYSSFPEAHGLAIAGKIEVVEDEEIRQTLWQDEWVKNFKGGLNDPDYTVLLVKPNLARGFYKMEKYEFVIT